MYKAWYCLGAVPYWFSRLSVKFKGHMAKKIVRNWAFTGLYLQFEFTDGYEMMHKDWSSIEEVPYRFSGWSVKFQGHRAKKYIGFDPKLGFFGLLLQFEFTDGFEMMLKSWSSIEEVPYCFSRSSVKFQGHKGQISLILSWIECFRTVTPVWIHLWLWNDLQSLK